MRFEVEIRKDGVVPNEPEKKAQTMAASKATKVK